jgi:hypothetical protein
MGNICKVTASSSMMPVGDLTWTVDTTDNLQQSLVYSNLMFDIVGLAVGKLGVEYSKWILDQDDERLASEVNKMQEALRVGIAK